MATQEVTVLKIAGKAAEDIIRTFASFRAQQRKDRDPDAALSSDHWTSRSRSKMDSFAEMLRAHRSGAPVVFCGTYVDMWSLPASPGFLPSWRRRATVLWSDEFNLECYPLPDRQRLHADIKRARRAKRVRERSGAGQEIRWAIDALENALLAWEPLVKDGALVWLRRCVAPSVTDAELRHSLESVPEWLGS